MPCISDRKELLNDLNSVSSLLVIRLKLKKETIPPKHPTILDDRHESCLCNPKRPSDQHGEIQAFLAFLFHHLPIQTNSKEGVQLLQFLGLVDELTHQRYLNPRIPCQRIASRDRTFNTLFNSKVEIFIRWKSTGTRIAPTPCGFSSLWPVGNGGAIAMLSEVFNVSEGSIENFTNRTLQAILDLEDRYDFNYQLSSRRVAIKQCIGIHKNQWQSLKSSRLLIWGSTSAARLNVWLRVCVILHNFLRGQSTSNWVPFESNLPEEVPSLDLDEDNLENCTLRDRLFRRFCESNDH
ncbi:hypothetical protein PSHT_02889 [Puccinia striiformis]|uniref:DDE Tnp4 domain-containing protein n=1 Tax=Puccinia striiformis TaxID=27350 RepID=A0A2S4WGZ6_9BASI|nr:hypothetical protein PSHT_02889 [Puccinia striiformis]